MIYANNWIKKDNSKSLDKISTDLNSDSKDVSRLVTTLNEFLSQLKQIEFNIENIEFKDEKSKIEFNQTAKKKLSKTLKSITSLENIYDPTGPIPFPKNVDLDDKFEQKIPTGEEPF